MLGGTQTTQPSFRRKPEPRGAARKRSGSQPETKNSKPETLPRIEERKDKEPAPAEFTPAERGIREDLPARRHEPDGDGAPIDYTHPGRSPPR